MRVLSFKIVLINALVHLLHKEYHEVKHSPLLSARTNAYPSQSRPEISPLVSVCFNAVKQRCNTLYLTYRIVITKWCARQQANNFVIG